MNNYTKNRMFMMTSMNLYKMICVWYMCIVIPIINFKIIWYRQYIIMYVQISLGFHSRDSQLPLLYINTPVKVI